MAANLLSELLDTGKATAQALGPAALGSLVAQFYERGMSWRDRLVAYVVGILVSYYVTLGLTAWFKFDQFMAQAVGFVLAMIAYRAAPRFSASLIDAVATLPTAVRDWLSKRKGTDA